MDEWLSKEAQEKCSKSVIIPQEKCSKHPIIPQEKRGEF